MSNYPDGVSDAHPYFNPQEGSVYVTCGNDEARVVPAYAIEKSLQEALSAAESGNKSRTEELIAMTLIGIGDVAKDADYECPFAGVVDVAISEEAEWTCPLCGATRTSDTLPEERDPDEGWDRDR